MCSGAARSLRASAVAPEPLKYNLDCNEILTSIGFFQPRIAHVSENYFDCGPSPEWRYSVTKLLSEIEMRAVQFVRFSFVDIPNPDEQGPLPASKERPSTGYRKHPVRLRISADVSTRIVQLRLNKSKSPNLKAIGAASPRDRANRRGTGSIKLIRATAANAKIAVEARIDISRNSVRHNGRKTDAHTENDVYCGATKVAYRTRSNGIDHLPHVENPTRRGPE